MAFKFDAGAFLSAEQSVISGYPITLSAWCRTSDVLTAHILSVGSSNGENILSVGLSTQFGGRRVSGPVRAEGAWEQAAITTQSHSSTDWFHVAAVFESATSRSVLLDGGSKGSANSSATPSSFSKTLVNTRTGLTPSYSGIEIAETAIWAAALSDDEVGLLARRVSPLCLTQRLDALVFYADCIRSLGYPYIGPAMTQTGTFTIADHPRTLRGNSGFFKLRKSTRNLVLRAEELAFALPNAVSGGVFLAGFDNVSDSCAGEAIG